MARLSTTLAAAVIAASLASGAVAQETATASTTGSAQIAEQGGIQTTGEVIFQDIVITPQVSVPPVVSSSGAANVVVSGAGGDAVSLAVPQTFRVINTETGETVTVVTTTSGRYAAIEGLQTLLSSGGTLSIDVGGAINISQGQMQAGEYQGLLAVVAQYN